MGSSPLARGLRGVVLIVGPLRGIIPARAGFTVEAAQRAVPPLDHPRSRGVYPAEMTPLLPPMGSSPLARGLRLRPGVAHVTLRIIPARAGFTRVSYSRMHITTGSSPLARGLQVGRDGPVAIAGIIPARAGFTATKFCLGCEPGDHPRSRGVYLVLV